MSKGVHTGRVGITSFFETGDTSNGDDFENEKLVNRTLGRGLVSMLGGEGQFSGTPLSTGSDMPAGEWIILDDSGYPHYRKTTSGTAITFVAASGSQDLYAIITLVSGVASDLADEAVANVEFETVLAGGAAPAPHAVKLGNGSVTASAFTAFTYDAGIWQEPINNLDGAGLEYETDGQLRIAAAAAGDGIQGGGGSALAIDVSDFSGEGVEDDGSENLRVKLDGGTVARSASGIKVADNGIAVGQLATAVQDLLPNVLITVGSEGSDIIPVTVQFRDAANNNLSEYCGFMAMLSDTAHGAVSADAPSGGWAAGVGTLLAEHTANLWGWFETNSSGVARIDITEAGVDTWYLLVLFDGKTYWSGTITFA